MNKCLILFLLLHHLSNLSAQERAYVPMAIESAKWFVLDDFQTISEPPWNYYRNRALYGISGDTTLNSLAYKKMYSYYGNNNTGSIDSLLIGVIRDDITARTVHFIHFDTTNVIVFGGTYGYGCAFECSPFVELTLYDFSMNTPTDSLVGCPGNSFGNAIGQDTSYQFMYGKVRKVINTDQFQPFYWYEGIGGQTSPFSRYANGYLGTLPTYYLEDYCVGSFDDCGVTQFLTNNKNVQTILPNVKIFPNPTSQSLNIHSPLDGLNISIINAIGQTIANYSIENTDIQIDVSNYSNGIYYIQFFKENQLLKTEKFVFFK